MMCIMAFFWRIEPEIMLVDFQMSEFEGENMLKIINEGKNNPSVSGLEDIINNTRKIGAFSFLKKPFNMSNLLETINGCAQGFLLPAAAGA